MKIIVISKAEEFEGENDLVSQMFEAGMELFHIRKPKLSTRSMKKYLESLPSKYHPRIVLHSHHELAGQFKVRGIHSTESHKSKAYFSTWLNMQYIKWKRGKIEITTSFHQINSLKEFDPEFEYVFMSPIFDSISKVGYRNRFNEETLIQVLKESKYKVIAMGGVEIDKLEKVHEMGFDGAAFLGGVWQKADPVEAFKAVIAKCQELNLA